MADANKAIVRRWFDEVWNQGRVDVIDELMDAYAVFHGLGPTCAGYEEWTFGSDGLIARSLGHYDEAEYQRQLQEGARPWSP